MAPEISFPLSTPQVQAAERAQSQAQNNPGNVQHSIAGQAERERQLKSETVSETEESENPNIDQEGHLGQEYEGSESEREASSGEEGPSPPPPIDSDLQGRFINVVI